MIIKSFESGGSREEMIMAAIRTIFFSLLLIAEYNYILKCGNAYLCPLEKEVISSDFFMSFFTPLWVFQ
jgi:hypothetical protein